MTHNGKSFDPQEKEWLRQKGIEYYQVTESILERDKSAADRLTTLQTKLLMCLYLLTSSRLKAAWDLFAIVKNMANNLDLSRPSNFTLSHPTHFGTHHMREADNATSQKDLHAELRRRAFWAIYTLDTYLSSMLGKALTFDEKHIHISFELQDDPVVDGRNASNLPASFHDGPEDDRPSLMLASMAHAKVSRIVRLTLKSLYLEPSAQYSVEVVDSLVNEMDAWERELPEFLKTKNSGGLQPIYARQSQVIRLAQQHALIMICRPSLPLSGLAPTLSETSHPDVSSHGHLQHHQDRCVDAALAIHDISSSLLKRGSIDGRFWYTAYILFCAATVMLVYIGHNPTSLRRQQIWDVAQRCCEMERRLMAANKLAQRYVAALEVSFYDCFYIH